MKQTSFIPFISKEHGGSLSHRKRRGPRPLSTQRAIHLTLKSNFAKGNRSLLFHKDLIQKIIKKVQKLFGIRVYQYAVCRNQIHVLMRGKNRIEIQNGLRVLAGHIAQQILLRCPYSESELKIVRATQPKSHPKNQRKFWSFLTYSRIVSWGKEFYTVTKYILQNTLEALNKVAYQPRKHKHNSTLLSSRDSPRRKTSGHKQSIHPAD
jgi:hypothetical protein